MTTCNRIHEGNLTLSGLQTSITEKYTTAKKKEITTLAIPIDVNTPEWVGEFIDYQTIISDNVGNFPVESVGIRRLKNNGINYSTIMAL